MPATAAKLKAAASSTSEQAESPEPQGSTSAVDVPIASLGEDDDDDDDEGEDDVGEHGGDVSTSVAGSKGKRKAEAVDGDDGEPSDGSEEGDEDATETPTEAEASGAAGGSSTGAHPWQAVWSPEKNGMSSKTHDPLLSCADLRSMVLLEHQHWRSDMDEPSRAYTTDRGRGQPATTVRSASSSC